MERENSPLAVLAQAFPLKGAQPAQESAGNPGQVWGMSGYRKTAGFPLLDLGAEGLYWGVSRQLWLQGGDAAEVFGAARECRCPRETCGVKGSNKSQYMTAPCTLGCMDMH